MAGNSKLASLRGRIGAHSVHARHDSRALTAQARVQFLARFEREVDPDFAHKRGAITTLYTAPPAGSVTVCLDQMGPEAAKSFPGQQLVRAGPDDTRPAARARQEIDDGRRGSGYIFGAFTPADGEALTAPYDGRTIANWVDFLEHVEAWLPPEMERVYAIADNLNIPIGVLPVSQTHAQPLLRRGPGGDKTAIELFIAGIRGWEAGLRQCLNDGTTPAQ